MKKNKLALFDLDDTLFDGDTEAEWVKYMDHRGFIQDFDFYSKMEAFEKNYREGRLDVDEYSEFLLSLVKIPNIHQHPIFLLYNSFQMLPSLSKNQSLE